MKRSFRLFLSLILAAALALALFACTTTATWQDQQQDTSKQSANISETNGSEKYIVYAALDGNGDLIASGSSTQAAAYAVVGYTGLVAELVIPDRYTDISIYEDEDDSDGIDHSLPVTKVLVASPYTSYKCSRGGVEYTMDDARLANNIVVTSIVFGSNVTFVGAGVCAGMVNLTSVTFTSSSDVVLGHAAFSACNSLTSVSGGWKTANDDDNPFLASGYTPSPASPDPTPAP